MFFLLGKLPINAKPLTKKGNTPDIIRAGKLLFISPVLKKKIKIAYINTNVPNILNVP